jgi:hypothetical protein
MVRQYFTYFVLLSTCSLIAAFVVQKSMISPLEITVTATWQQACGRTFIKQRIKISNRSSTAWCVTRRVCGNDKLLRIEDDLQHRIAFGMSCGRPNSGYKIQSYIQEFVPIEPNGAMSLYYGGAAEFISLEDRPGTTLSKSRTYFGRAEFEILPCAEVQQVCRGTGCTWEWLKRVRQIHTLSYVPVLFAGESCPKGFNAWALDADPP